MVPKALEMSSRISTISGFTGGFLAVYRLDLFINRGKLVGEKAEQRPALATSKASIIRPLPIWTQPRIRSVSASKEDRLRLEHAAPFDRQPIARSNRKPGRSDHGTPET
jgi:hypothetical protein